MNRHLPFALALTLTLACSALAYQTKDPVDPSKPFTGKVFGIADGDTITVLVEKTPHKIRLAGIDAPDAAHASGTAGQKALSEKVFGREVRIEWKARNCYQRIIGEIYLDDLRICLEE